MGGFDVQVIDGEVWHDGAAHAVGATLRDLSAIDAKRLERLGVGRIVRRPGVEAATQNDPTSEPKAAGAPQTTQTAQAVETTGTVGPSGSDALVITDGDAPPRLNVNTATAEELAVGIIGVGDKVAARIVAFREKHGPFARLEDLTRVRGIGIAIVEAQADRLTV